MSELSDMVLLPQLAPKWLFVDSLLRDVEALTGLPSCLAGGAVRDTVTLATPKDFDVFVLGAARDELAAIDWARLPGSRDAWLPQLANGDYGSLVVEMKVASKRIQIMHTPHLTAADLVDSFDWDVSRWARMNEQTVCEGTTPAKDQELTLHRITNPISSIRRGVRFSERFDMRITLPTWQRLAAAVTALPDGQA